MKTCVRGSILYFIIGCFPFITVSPQAVFVSSGSSGIVLDTSLCWHMHGLDWRNEALDAFPGGTARVHITGRSSMEWHGNEVHLSELCVETSHSLVLKNPQVVVNDFLDLRLGKVEVSESSRFRLGPSLWNPEPWLEVGTAHVEGWFGWYWERTDSSSRLFPLGGREPAPVVLRAQKAPDLGGYVDLRFVDALVPDSGDLPLVDSTGPIHGMVVDFLEPGYWEHLAESDPLSCLGGKWQIQVRHPVDRALPVHQLRLLGWNDTQGWFVMPYGQYQDGDSAVWVMDPTSISNTDSSSFNNNPKFGTGTKDPDLPLHPWLKDLSWDCQEGFCGSLMSWAGADFLVFEKSHDLVEWQRMQVWYPPYTEFCFNETSLNRDGFGRLTLVFSSKKIENLWVGELPCDGGNESCIPWFAGNELQVPCGQHSYTLFDLQGKEIYSGNLVHVELPGLPSGVYLWRSDKPGTPAYRVVKP